MAVIEGLTYDSTHELEVVQVLLVDVTLVVGVVSHTIRCQFEQRVIRVEHCSRQLNEEISG